MAAEARVSQTGNRLDEQVRQAMRAELSGSLEELRRFVDRRIAELSTEIHATVQLVDYSETNLSAQLARIHDQIAQIVAMPVAAARNSGMELEAVVQATEVAANRIMEAAEAIGGWLREGRRDPESVEAVAQKLNTIFEACTFQDLTGQRIRRAIEHLQHVEAMLAGLMQTHPEAAPAGQTPPAPELGQGDIDTLFA